uniref:Uncharacterized protein n=1 Tax=Stenotrophomonas maltophilia TaxID=40324 RepID=A0A0A0QXF4_STEMA|nr:hypothetical protein [Stenotrophomonas maltophilia]
MAAAARRNVSTCTVPARSLFSSLSTELGCTPSRRASSVRDIPKASRVAAIQPPRGTGRSLGSI